MMNVLPALLLSVFVPIIQVQAGEYLDVKKAETEWPYWHFKVKQPDGKVTNLTIRGENPETVANDVREDYCAQIGVPYCVIKGPWRENDANSPSTRQISRHQRANTSAWGSSSRH